jgi:hypothetical protein
MDEKMEKEYDLTLTIKNKEVFAESWNRIRIEVENISDRPIGQITLRFEAITGADSKELINTIDQLNPKERVILDSTLIKPVMMEELALSLLVWFMDSERNLVQIEKKIPIVVRPPQRFCGLLSVCSRLDVDATEEYFEAHAFGRQGMDDLRDAIEKTFESEELKDFRNLKPYHPEKEVTSDILLCKICEKIRSTRFGFYEISSQNPNVMLELGMAVAFGKPSIILVKKGCEIPSDLEGLTSRVDYESFKDLTAKLKERLYDFLHSTKT